MALDPRIILVVDDCSSILDAIRQVLQPAGYEVLSADNGYAALETCRMHSGPIDLLVTDLVMPEMDGRELAGCVTASRPNTRVLFMSGEVPAADLQPSKPFLVKPYGPHDLLQKVEEVLAY